MRILGIDYGQAKLGLALAEASLAEPLKVIRVKSLDDAVLKIEEIVKIEGVEKIVVGISEGAMGQESESFSLALGKVITIPIEVYDETLSTQEAQERSILSGISRKKRKEMEDAYAATIMLQNYLDFQA